MRSSIVRSACAVLLLLVFAGDCAKRMPPPSPDRFAPRLELVRARSRSGLDLVFDELLDLARSPTESLSITAADGGRLDVRGVTVARTGERLLVWTAPQSGVMYSLTAQVSDVAGNVARVRARFRGSNAVDTLAPRVASVRPTQGRTGHPVDDVQYDFSEPMDTLVAPMFLAVPRSLDTLLQVSWDPGWQRLSLGRQAIRAGSGPAPRQVLAEEDSVESGGTQGDDAPDSSFKPMAMSYVLLLPGLADLEGNRTRSPTLTSYTRDSVLPEASVRGWVEGPGPSVVFFSAESTVALAVTDSSGLFSLWVAPGVYQVTAVSDTDRDGFADYVGHRADFNTESESLRLRLEIEVKPRAIGRYRR